MTMIRPAAAAPAAAEPSAAAEPPAGSVPPAGAVPPTGAVPPVPAPAASPADAPRWTDLLATATDDSLAALGEAAGRDWSRPAHGLDWTCRQTLDHLALGLTGYAGLLIARPADRYITLFASLDPQAPIPACLDGLRIASALVGSTLRDTAPDVRAWHPWGPSDSTGFAAMAVTELTLHAYDITRALGVPWTPPDATATAVLARLFPDAPTGRRPSGTLLWCTGRATLPGLPRRVEWQWDGAVR